MVAFFCSKRANRRIRVEFVFDPTIQLLGPYQMYLQFARFIVDEIEVANDITSELLGLFAHL